MLARVARRKQSDRPGRSPFSLRPVPTRLCAGPSAQDGVGEGIADDGGPAEAAGFAWLAWRTLPYAFAQAGYAPEGPVAFALEAPGGETWHFAGDSAALTTISGPAVDLCRVAGQRAQAADTALEGEGPDAAAVLDLVRTFA